MLSGSGKEAAEQLTSVPTVRTFVYHILVTYVETTQITWWLQVGIMRLM